MTSAVCEGRTQRQVIAIIFVSLAVFLVTSTGIAILAGTKLPAFGWWVLVPSVSILLLISFWLLLKDPDK